MGFTSTNLHYIKAIKCVRYHRHVVINIKNDTQNVEECLKCITIPNSLYQLISFRPQTDDLNTMRDLGCHGSQRED
jgi:hypothetical protein